MEQMAVTIQNLENAANYSSKFYIFDENGGDIGSDSSATFRCQDANGSIHAKHAKIGYEEGFLRYPHTKTAIYFMQILSQRSQATTKRSLMKGTCLGREA